MSRLPLPRFDSRCFDRARRLGWRFVLIALMTSPLPAQSTTETTRRHLALDPVPGESWPTRTPEESGLDAAALREFESLVGGSGCIIHRGHLVHAWGEYDRPHDVASALKPVYGYFLMRAVADGRLGSFDEPVIEQLPEALDLPVDDPDRTLTFRHLAFQTASLGYTERPGEAFDYNDGTMGLFWDALINGVYGTRWEQAEEQVIAPLLSKPLGLQDGTPAVLQRNTGRFRLSCRDFCRFGLLYLRQGDWNGTELLRRDLAMIALSDPLPLAVPRTTGVESPTRLPLRSIGGGGNQCDHAGGYSWLWWLNRRCRDGSLWFPDVTESMAACFGHGGAEGMAIFPEEHLIVSWVGNELHQDRRRGNAAFAKLLSAVRSPGRIRYEDGREIRPLPGQVIIDPRHPGRLALYVDGSTDPPGSLVLQPCVPVGPGDPEELLWRDTEANVDLLIERGARCAYVTLELRDFGGGSAPEGPNLEATIAAWNRTLCRLEAAGIVTVLFLFDDGARRDDWPEFVERVVERLKHRRLLIWCVAEEYREWGDDAAKTMSAIAARLRTGDRFGHPIGIHQWSGTTFDFRDDPSFDLFLMQLNVDSAEALHAGVGEARRSVGAGQGVAMVECAGHADRNLDEFRRMNWACLMAGASLVQVLDLGRASDRAERNSIEKFRACEIASRFLESLDFGAFEPTSIAGMIGPEFAMRSEAGSRLLYGATTERSWTLDGVLKGSYRVRFLDPATGEEVRESILVDRPTDSVPLSIPERFRSGAVLLIEPFAGE